MHFSNTGSLCSTSAHSLCGGCWRECSLGWPGNYWKPFQWCKNMDGNTWILFASQSFIHTAEKTYSNILLIPVHKHSLKLEPVAREEMCIALPSCVHLGQVPAERNKSGSTVKTTKDHMATLSFTSSPWMGKDGINECNWGLLCTAHWGKFQEENETDDRLGFTFLWGKYETLPDERRERARGSCLAEFGDYYASVETFSTPSPKNSRICTPLRPS